MTERQLPIILALGTTQTLAWASSYYLPAILADPIARELGISNNWFFAAFSGALVISGLLGPRVGRQIDIVGGRQVLSISNVALAVGLALLGSAHSIILLIAAWLMLGIGMGLGLYDAAFGALGRIYGDKARGAITGITLLAGLASTVGWPLSAWGLDTIGWRYTCFAWAAAHIVIGLPLNLIFLPQVDRTKAAAVAAVKPHISIDRTMVLAGGRACEQRIFPVERDGRVERLVSAILKNAKRVTAGDIAGSFQRKCSSVSAIWPPWAFGRATRPVTDYAVN